MASTVFAQKGSELSESQTTAKSYFVLFIDFHIR